MDIFTKQVLAWGDGLIHDYLLDVLKRQRVRSPGDEYSTKQDDGITNKMTQVPQVGMGSPTRDIGHEPTAGDPPEISSGNKEERDIYGVDLPPDDEERPGGGRMINPKGEPPVTTHDQVSLQSDDPVMINSLFNSNSDLDRRPRQRTQHFLSTLYNRKPAKMRSAASTSS